MKDRVDPKPKRGIVELKPKTGIRITIVRVPTAKAKRIEPKKIEALGDCLLKCLKRLKLYESNPSSEKAVLFIEPFEYAIDYDG